MEKTKQLYVLAILVKCHCATISFDMWMLKVELDVFTLVIKILRVYS